MVRILNQNQANECLKDIVCDGHSSGEEYVYDEIFANLSLKKALIAYFSTYKRANNAIVGPNSAGKDADLELFSSYMSIIVHLQHFVELLCKSILRERHELLATEVSNDHTLMHDLLLRRPLSQAQEDRLQRSKSISFSDALRRTRSLIKDKRIDEDKYGFFAKHGSFLESLSALRNRILHRATFALSYQAIDILFAMHVIPFVRDAEHLEQLYSGIWRYNGLFCGLDPLDEIRDAVLSLDCGDNSKAGGSLYSEYRKKYDVRRVAFLKQLGAAAYENPYNMEEKRLPIIGPGIRERVSAAEDQIADVAEECKGVCPVCGERTLEKHVLSADEVLSLRDLTEGVNVRSLVEVECALCSFSTDSTIGEDASSHYEKMRDFRDFLGVQSD